MSSSSQPPKPQVVIPESLRAQLGDFRRHLWRVKILESVAAGVIGLLVSFLLVYGLDRFWQTPGWARLTILIAGVSLFTVFAPYWLHRWVWQQRREAQLARLIAKRYPGLGDRLLGVIELQGQEGSSDSLSPRLREAAMEAVAAETGKRKLEDALPPQRHRRWTLAALALGILVASAFTLTPRAGVNALERWLMPLSDTERYTFTKLDNPPVYRAVAYGEAFEIDLRLSRNSENRPSGATGRYGVQPEMETKLDQNIYHFTFAGQQDPGTIVFHIGDLRHETRIEPLQRPAIESIKATINAPEYLGIPERTVDLNTGVISLLEGSRMRVEMSATRALASGAFGPAKEQWDLGGPVTPERLLESVRPEEPDEQLLPPLPSPAEGALVIAGSAAGTPEIVVGSAPVEIPFSWTDKLGLEGQSGFRLRVDSISDAPPTCYLQGVDRQKAILPEETIDFEVLSEDDFGVKRMGIEWAGQLSRPGGDPPANGEMELGKGGPEERRMASPASFSPAAFGIEPQKILLRGYSEDFLPGRGRVYSEPVTIYVLTRDEHAQMLKSKFDRAITELEDLARREQALLDENQRLDQLDGEQLQKDENQRRLENQKDAESESQRRMQELTERMESLMKDAARNGDIEKDTLKKMAESLKSMQELSKDNLPKVEEKLGEAKDMSNTPEKSDRDMSQAVEEQKKAMEKMQEAIAKANDANRQFEAGTFVNRLKKAAGEQTGIANSLVEAYERILGKKTSRVDPSDQRRLDETGKQQANTASDVRWIQEDLASYFARTKTETFKEILTVMRESQIDVGLEEVRSLLSKNHSYMATEGSQKWATALSEWAKKLEGEKDKNGGGGGGGGGGGQDPEDEDFEFMLRVMKLVQQEQDVRAQTRALEQLRRTENQNGKNP